MSNVTITTKVSIQSGQISELVERLEKDGYRPDLSISEVDETVTFVREHGVRL